MNQFKNLSQEQQILYSALMMPLNQLPSFPESSEVVQLGVKIHALYKNKTLTKMYLDEQGLVHCS